jgi:SET domain-containing protein
MNIRYKLVIDNNLFIKESTIKNIGNGVFTNKSIKNGQIIEICPIIKINNKFLFQKDNILNDYIFNDPLNDDNKLLVFGYGSIYNHSNDPNVDYYYDNDNNKMIYKAIKDINKDSELFISYGRKWWKSRNKRNKD